MDLSFNSWGSPVGISIFLVGLAIFFRMFFSGIATVIRAKTKEDTRT